jgi:hypothetical protein
MPTKVTRRHLLAGAAATAACAAMPAAAAIDAAVEAPYINRLHEVLAMQKRDALVDLEFRKRVFEAMLRKRGIAVEQVVGDGRTLDDLEWQPGYSRGYVSPVIDDSGQESA